MAEPHPIHELLLQVQTLEERMDRLLLQEDARMLRERVEHGPVYDAELVQEEAARQQPPHTVYPGEVTPLGQPQVMPPSQMQQPPIDPISPSNAHLIPTIDQSSMPGTALSAMKNQLSQLLREQRSPTADEQQQQIRQMLKSNPQLMASFRRQQQVLAQALQQGQGWPSAAAKQDISMIKDIN